MTRVKISVFILSIILIVSVISGIYVNKSCEKLLELSGSVQESLESGSKDKALESAEIFCENWKKFRKRADIILKNERLAEISRISSRIIPMIKAESDEAAADIQEITEMIGRLRAC